MYISTRNYADEKRPTENYDLNNDGYLYSKQ